MLLFQTPLALPALIGLIAVHALSVFLPDRFGKYAGYANILFHIACLFLLLSYHFPIDEAVLFYMISIFFYTVFSVGKYYVLPKFVKKAEEETENIEEAEK